MSFSSSSDSEDKEKQSAFEAAIDCKLFHNSMFAGNKMNDNLSHNSPLPKNKNLRSQRYLDEDELESSTWFWQDAIVTPASQEILAKKFTKLLEQIYECSDVSPMQNVSNICGEKLNKPKEIKLLSNANCYLKNEMDNSLKLSIKEKSPRKRFEFKRRIIDDEEDVNKEEVFKQLAVEGSDILKGLETRHWTEKKPRKDKVFYYKLDKSDGILKEVAPENEFTALRLKNNWDESKIAEYKKRSKIT